MVLLQSIKTFRSFQQMWAYPLNRLWDPWWGNCLSTGLNRSCHLHRFVYWHCYEDDVVSRTEFLNHLSGLYPGTRRIGFLDLEISLEGGRQIIGIHWKAPSTDMFIDASSSPPPHRFWLPGPTCDFSEVCWGGASPWKVGPSQWYWYRCGQRGPDDGTS